ncbi:MAG TPA: ATP-binding protein [candidate division Zixibacteria bacterium]|nr:ATP-binding protein [candidate division Zixibacteria bacterium]
MTKADEQIGEETSQDPGSSDGIRISIATKLVLSFLLVIVFLGLIFTTVGILIISDHIQADARAQAASNINSAQEVYSDNLEQLENVVLTTAGNNRIQDAITSLNMERVTDELLGIRFREELDILTVTDSDGTVLLRASDLGSSGDNVRHEELLKSVILNRELAASTLTISYDDLRRESGLLAERVSRAFTELPEREGAQDGAATDALMLGAAAPIFDVQGTLIGAVMAGILLNTDRDLICGIDHSVFNDAEYKGRDIGFVSIYQDDVAILTCPAEGDSTELVGTILADGIYEQVVETGEPWIESNLVAGSTYVTAIEPIQNSQGDVIGFLQIGTLEQVYLDIRNQVIVAFMAVTLIGALVAMIFAYYIAQRISGPIKELVFASRNLAHGDLNARIETSAMSKDELAEMAVAFNVMAATLQERDERLREFATTRIGQAERLALIGKLSANVAHELNNPLQGIVTYSHLLIERMPEDFPNIDYIQKIVVQANRCRDIIRGLLDFARHGEHVKSLSNVNIVLQDSISLLENQALFHNIVIVKEFDALIPLALIDPSGIERVFINMIINAAEAMEGEGRLSLRTSAGPSRDYVVVEIEDTGYGIPRSNLKKIFDPFFTTKEVGRGTGLGLAISYGIVSDHGGTISVESKLRTSTTFTIRLPVKEGVKVPQGIELPARGKELTLLSEL